MASQIVDFWTFYTLTMEIARGIRRGIHVVFNLHVHLVFVAFG
nr:MAG TPA: hypothetical protein [Caudoviricetes sp.]